MFIVSWKSFPSAVGREILPLAATERNKLESLDCISKFASGNNRSFNHFKEGEFSTRHN